MKCRYCGNAYADEDRTCGGCGAPKDAIRSLLDAPATPEHWSNSLKDTIIRVLIVTGGVLVGAFVLAAIGLAALGAVLAFFWAMPAAPTLMTYVAWRDAKGDFVGFFVRLFLVMGVWSGISFAVLLAIGVSASL